MGREMEEWLEADGLGGYASGTVSGVRTRRYHALLCAAVAPPARRMVLVSGLDAFVHTAAGRFAVSAQRYVGDVVHPDGDRRIIAFSGEPWPTWTFRLEDGTELVQELFSVRGAPETVVRFARVAGRGPCRLELRLFLAGRDHHATHHENPVFSLTAEPRGGAQVFAPYPGVPALAVATHGAYHPDPCWYRSFYYTEEAARGLEAVEDLASPGVFTFDLDTRDATLTLRAGDPPPVEANARRLAERARRGRLSAIERAAESYWVRRGQGSTIIAGYPWFTDWGRDTCIALRGLSSRAGGRAAALEMLEEWAGCVSEGMLPNRFPDEGGVPEYTSVDASLWFVIAAQGLRSPAIDEATRAIVAGYASGTRFGIRMDDDGLLFAGRRGLQLTWMDAKVGDRVVTPRRGKPVEVQALWINALELAAELDRSLLAIAERARAAFARRFWNAARGCLYDVVDVDFERGQTDGALRPNQIYAVGGLPRPVLAGAKARAVVDVVESELLTPHGLRSLAPGEPGYRSRYQGGVLERDTAYHQGTVWPFLIGPFVEAWLRVHGDTHGNRSLARARFLAPLLAHLEHAGLGHVFEIADGDAPHRPRGCPFQAWSLGELLRALDLTARRR